MGIKDLWSVLTPYAERKPISELRGKIVAIDLAGWVCESLNVVDYYVHPKHHLKNLFFRTTYLIWEEVIPVFVLEGEAPILKSQVIAKRNELQFRGVKPKDKVAAQSQSNTQETKSEKGRTRFNHVLRQCENLLKAMGMQCVQGPGEAEAYCAFLNEKGLVDGVISQDSDCFAYGAVRVYRNFSVSNQGALAAQGGAVDIYDMRQISSKIAFGRNKIIAMALLCGCDYCPEGIGGIGRDSVLKLFDRYKDDEILQRIRNWRKEDDKYTALEMRVDDKSVCSNCGHIGRTQSHKKNGCGVCRTPYGCDETLWKDERLSLKSEILLRRKALADLSFPNEEVIKEFLTQPDEIPKLQLSWNQPNIVKFIKQIGNLLQWNEIYCFQKFFPILTRWHVKNDCNIKQTSCGLVRLTPKEILKKRIVKGVPCLELLWQDEGNYFKGLIPDEQLNQLEESDHNAFSHLWTTIEPLHMMERAYGDLVEKFLKSQEKPKKKTAKRKAKGSASHKPLSSLDNLDDLLDATKEVAATIKPKNARKRASSRKGLQMIDKFFNRKVEQVESTTHQTPCKAVLLPSEVHCSTPLTKSVLSDLPSDEDEAIFDMSNIINEIVEKTQPNHILTSYNGKQLRYEPISRDISLLLNQRSTSAALSISKSFDDLDILSTKKRYPSNSIRLSRQSAKRISLDDSFDILVKMGNKTNIKMSNVIKRGSSILVDSCKEKECLRQALSESNFEDDGNASHFFSGSYHQENEDNFEKYMEISFAAKKQNENYMLNMKNN
ncbi:XPG-like endonuclease [Glossina fuscipes fuscipes]